MFKVFISYLYTFPSVFKVIFPMLFVVVFLRFACWLRKGYVKSMKGKS